MQRTQSVWPWAGAGIAEMAVRCLAVGQRVFARWARRQWPAMLAALLLLTLVQPAAADTRQALDEALLRSLASASAAVVDARRQARSPAAQVRAEQAASEQILLYGDLRDVSELLSRWDAQPDLKNDPVLGVERKLLQAAKAAAEGQHFAAARLLLSLQKGLPAAADDVLRWRVQLATAINANDLGQSEDATRALTEAVQEAAKSGWADREAAAWVALGKLQERLRDYAEALRCHQQALKVVPAWAVQTKAYALLGEAQMRNALGQRKEALAQLAQPEALFADSGHDRATADLLLIKGYVLRKLDRPKEAVAPLTRAFEIRARLGRVADEVNSLTHLAGVMRDLKDFESAAAYARRAVALAEATDNRFLLWDASHGLAMSLAGTGQHAAAYEAMAKSSRALMEASKFEQIHQAALIRERFETDRQTLENAHLQDRLAWERGEQQRLSGLIWALSALLMLLVLSVAALVYLYRHTRRHARTDGLTGLYNRLHTLERCETEVARAHRHALPLAVLMFDLDLFKRINDEHGHATGDRVLQEVARHVRGALRVADTAGRVGGEEFLLVLPHTGAQAAWQLAERLRVLLAAQVQVVPGWPVTASFGVALLQPGQGAAALMQQADQALYRAKARGRNRAEMAEGSLDGPALGAADGPLMPAGA